MKILSLIMRKRMNVILTKMMIHIMNLVMKIVRIFLYNHEYCNHSLSTADCLMTNKN